MNKFLFLVPVAVTASLMGCPASDARITARNVDVFAENFVGHFPAETVRGRAGLADQVTAHRRAFPDWTEEVEDTIASRDRVVVRFTSRGTNLGAFLGNPPTNNHVEISEAAIFRLTQDGTIVEQWVYPDMLSMQRQLGSTEQQ